METRLNDFNQNRTTSGSSIGGFGNLAHLQSIEKRYKQWRGGNEAAGEAARLMAPPPPPPPSHTFLPLGLDASSGRVSCHRHNMQ